MGQPKPTIPAECSPCGKAVQDDFAGSGAQTQLWALPLEENHLGRSEGSQLASLGLSTLHLWRFEKSIFSV